MIETKVTCDSCGKVIEHRDTRRDIHVNSAMGDNRIPLQGWHFHHKCSHHIVDKLIELIEIDKNEQS